MLRNYLVVGVRALLKNRAFAAINIAGLAIGMAAALVILLYVRDQTSYDRFFPDAERVYQLQATQTDTETGATDDIQSSPYAAGRALVKDYPQIDAASYMDNFQPIILNRGTPIQRTMTKVDPDFLRIFPLTFVAGSPATALPDVNAVIVSERTATALFGTTQAVGRTITAITRGVQKAYRVTGVYRDLPKNSHLAMGMIALWSDADLGPDQKSAWGWFNGYFYVKLKPGADVAAINASLEAWKERNAPRKDVGGVQMSDAQYSHYRLVALPGIHLGPGKHGPAGNEGDRATILTFALLAVLILAIACANFTNLSTARASQRAREVALRKVLGASRGQLVAQFLTESVLVAAIAMLLGLAIAELALPWLRGFLDAGIPLRYWGRGGVLPVILALTVAVGLAGGLYPAFHLSRFQPARTLKANRSAADGGGSGMLRNVLVVAQFAISIGLIICTAVIYAQTMYARSVDPGFRRPGIVQIDNASRTQVIAIDEALRREIARVPGVEGIARTSIAVNTASTSNNVVMLPGRTKQLILGTYSVDYGYFEVMGMKLIAGRTLSRDHALDDAFLPEQTDNAFEQALVRRGINVVVNESSARQMGFAHPADALGKSIRVSYVHDENGMVPATIVGVVGDTRFRSPHEQVEDIIFSRSNNNLGYYVVRVDTNDQAAALRRIEAAWKRMLPTVPFEARFAEDANSAMTRGDAAAGTIFAAFAGLSVVIGCLGLFGLASFSAERRTKEIGIRKVMGARTRDIVRLLIWQFTRPVLLANLIAWPVAWWVMRRWLAGFDARIALGPAPFLAAGLLALAIAVVTIGGHALRVARANPIHALRYE